MSPPGDAESRRPTQGTDSQKTTTAKQSTATIRQGTDLPGLTREQFALIHNWIADANGVDADRLGFVALVETPNGTYRRRAYLTLESAHRAMERADKRGLDSRIVLCELRPVVS